MALRYSYRSKLEVWGNIQGQSYKCKAILESVVSDSAAGPVMSIRFREHRPRLVQLRQLLAELATKNNFVAFVRDQLDDDSASVAAELLSLAQASLDVMNAIDALPASGPVTIAQSAGFRTAVAAYSACILDT